MPRVRSESMLVAAGLVLAIAIWMASGLLNGEDAEPPQQVESPEKRVLVEVMGAPGRGRRKRS